MRPLAATLCTVLLAGACTDPAPPAPSRPDALVVGTTQTDVALDPADCFDAFCAYVLLPNVHAGLVRYDAAARPVPDLAESWEVADDATRYTFTLRPGVELHDGTPVTAEVVKHSLERVRSVAGDAAFLLYDTTSDEPSYGIVEVATPDERTVEIRLAAPDGALPARLAFPVGSVVSPRAFPAEGTAPEDASGGAGPYAIRSVGGDGTIELEAVASTAAERRVLVRPFDSPAELRRALRDGDVDVAASSFRPEEVSELEDVEDVELHDTPGPTTRLLAFNVATEPFDSVDVRRDVAAAVERTSLSASVLGGTAEPLLSLVADGIYGHRPAFEGTSGAAAATDRVAVDLWYTPSHYGDTEQAVAERLEESLEGTGRFDVTLRTLEWAGYTAAIGEGSLGMYLLGWFPDVLDPAQYLRTFLGAREAAAIGSRYSGEEATTLLEELQRTADVARREEIAVRLQEIAAADVPYVPLVQPKWYLAARTGVEGAEPTIVEHLPLAGIAR